MTDDKQTHAGLVSLDPENVDVVLIAPFEEAGRREFDKFLDEVIGPAIIRVEERTKRQVHAVVLNDLLENSVFEHDYIYRLLHLADIVLADLSAVNGALDAQVLSAFSIRQSLTSKPALPFTRDEAPIDYPFNVGGTVLNVASEHGRDSAQALFYSEILAAFEGKPTRKYISHVFSSLTALRTDLRGSPNSKGRKPVYEAINYQPRHNRKDIQLPRFEVAVGDMREVKHVDVWINPENTHMEMARVFDTSISGIIRHMSSGWSHGGKRSDDFIRRKLAEALKGEEIAPGGALMTACKGQLKAEHFVKKVVHVAAVSANGDEPGCGYMAVNDVGICIKNALEKVQDYNLSWMGSGHNRLASVVTPLLGVGSNPELAYENVFSLLTHAAQFFDTNPDSMIDRFVVLAYSMEDRRLINKALKRIPQLSNKIDAVPNMTNQTDTNSSGEN